jgi:hypothetical protein
VYAGIRLYNDVSMAPASSSARPSILVGLALLIALGFEMCSGSHVPTTYVINKAPSDSQIAALVQTSDAAAAVVSVKASGRALTGDPRPPVEHSVTRYQFDRQTLPALAVQIGNISSPVQQYNTAR